MGVGVSLGVALQIALGVALRAAIGACLPKLKNSKNKASHY
jgi:hypothetical protein